MIGVVGLSHQTAGIDVRERLALPRDEVPTVLRSLVQGPWIAEAMLISTCNRVEFVVVPVTDCAPALAAVRSALAASAPGIEAHLVSRCGGDALAHLFRVAASLDSLVLGEPQILGQVKMSLAMARAAGTVGSRLDRAVGRAIRAAKRVRAETALGAGLVSVPTVAVDLARQIFEALAGRTVVLVGSGEMAETVARRLRAERARVLVVGRNAERVAVIASAMAGEPRPWDALSSTLAEADVVVCSTASPGHVIDVDLVGRIQRQRRGRGLFLIDLAVPRDVDPRVEQLDNVFCYNIDDLSQVVAASRSARAAEARAAEGIIREEVTRFERWLAAERVTPVLVAFRRRIQQLLDLELDRTLAGRLRHLDERDRAQLRVMVGAVTKKICHVPTLRLRDLAVERVVDGDHADVIADALVELFALDAELGLSEPPAAPASARDPVALAEAPPLRGVSVDAEESQRLEPRIRVVGAGAGGAHR